MDSATERHWEAVRVEHPRARQPWRCCTCYDVIPVGEHYRKISGMRDGMWLCFRTCATCSTPEAES